MTMELAMIALLLVAPLLVSVGLMWQWPKCRRPLAWIAIVASLVCLCISVNTVSEGNWLFDTAPAGRSVFLGVTSQSVNGRILIMLGQFVGLLSIESLAVAVIGFLWSWRRPLGIGRGVVVESEEEVKRGA